MMAKMKAESTVRKEYQRLQKLNKQRTGMTEHDGAMVYGAMTAMQWILEGRHDWTPSSFLTPKD